MTISPPVVAPDNEGKWTGVAIPRKEDARFLRGIAEYVADRRFPGLVDVAVVRSIYPHAKISNIDFSNAASKEGVLDVVTGQIMFPEVSTIRAGLDPPFDVLSAFPLAVDYVRYVGEPVAVVIATDQITATDAAELIEITYEPLPAVIDPYDALKADSPLVHDEVGTNLIWERSFHFGNFEAISKKAGHVISTRAHFHRYTSAPLEPAAAVVEYNRLTGVFDIFSNLQSPERHREKIAHALRVPREKLHFECPDIGGGFGIKDQYEWVILLGYLAKRVGRPVRFLEDRTEHMMASHHGNEVWFEAEMALSSKGIIEGMRIDILHDAGAYVGREPKGAVNQLRHIPSVYKFRNLDLNFRSIVTNRCPTGPNRGYGKAPSGFIIERMIDEAAVKLGMDPLELRRINLVTPDEMPYETPTGSRYDGGDYPEALRLAAEHFGYEKFLEEQKRARAEGRLLGCGIAMGMEASSSNSSLHQLLDKAAHTSGDSEKARVNVDQDGKAHVALGTVPQGHGHETVVSQIVADELGLTPWDVTVTTGYDSGRDPSTPYSGTHASRFTTMGVGAVLGAAQLLKAKLLKIAAHNTGIAAKELDLVGGKVVQNDGISLMELGDIARIANADLGGLPKGMEAGSEAIFTFNSPFGLPGGVPRADGGGNFSLTYAYACSMIGVEIDSETGGVTLLKVVHVDDCGNLLNPGIIEGMTHGAIAHQIGAALFEKLEYNKEGQLLTTNFLDYLAPSAAEFPSFDAVHLITPSTTGSLGARGGGEGGGSPQVATIAAVADALRPVGAVVTESHMSPESIWRMIATEG